MIRDLLQSPLGLLNFLFLQWFFVRRTKVYDEDTGQLLRYGWLGPVWPLTGWWSDYRFLGRKSHAGPRQ